MNNEVETILAAHEKSVILEYAKRIGDVEEPVASST